ncbi:c-type cytochrome [candidate division KSB1 bacterium]|nr:c-type cytochrome [candidate division KSB1 bacterium]
MRAKFILISFLASAIDVLSLAGAGAQNISPNPDAVATGAMLYQALRCGLCHEVSAGGLNTPPSLANAGDKFQTTWIEAYLKAPHRRRWESTGVRPILRMPNFLLSDEEVRALAAFLSTQRDTTRIKQLSFDLRVNDSAIVAEGKQIFQEYACYGCHKIAGEGGEVGPDLNGVGSRLQPPYLAAFLRNPQAFIPGSPMKNLDLWEEEVQALAAYLISLE